MPKCSFCHKDYDLHKGLTLILNDGKILHFCSSKCRKNSELGRQPKRVKWIKKPKKQQKKEMGKTKERG